MTYRKGSDASGGTAPLCRAHGPGCLTPVPLCRSSLEVRSAPSFAWVDMRARGRGGVIYDIQRVFYQRCMNWSPSVLRTLYLAVLRAN